MTQPQTRLGYRDGWLCAVETETDLLEPRRVTTYWPLARGSNERWIEFIGKDLDRAGLYTYSLPGLGLLRLAKDGKTLPVSVESVPIPKPPRVRVQTRWRSGRWEKYDTRKGWVTA